MKENPSRPGVYITPEGRVFVEIAPQPSSGGYATIKLPGGGGRGKKGLTVRRHTLVAETYVGPRPYEGAQVRHWDGDPSNDSPPNLIWGSAKENGEDTVRHGRSTRGVKNPQAKLTEDQAREIKGRLAVGESGKELASEFALHPVTISDIKNGRTWGWLK